MFLYLATILPPDFEPVDGHSMSWPDDDRLWTYSFTLKKYVPGPGKFTGGDSWLDNENDDWIDPNPGRSLPWVL